MKAKFLFVIICICVLSGCANSYKTTVTNSERKSEAELEPHVSDGDLDIDFSQPEHMAWQVCHRGDGVFTSDGDSYQVMIISEKQSDDPHLTPVFLFVCQRDGFLTYEIGKFDQHVISSGNLYVVDVDRDGLDEIVYSGEVSGNGGTISRVYKVMDDLIVLLDENGRWDDILTGNCGYSLGFLEDYRLEIRNDSVGFRVVQDIKDFFTPSFFDERGVPEDEKYQISLKTGNSRTVVENEKDGTVSLKYMQYVGDTGPWNCGYIVTTLQYNHESKKFEAVAAEYVEGIKAYFGWDIID